MIIILNIAYFQYPHLQAVCWWANNNTNNNIRLLKTDKLQLQTLKWYMQVLYKHNTGIKLKKKNNISNSQQRAFQIKNYNQLDKNSGMEFV